MTIQGIITGFCNPENKEKHVVLVGRGAVHHLVEDGKIIDSVVDFDEAMQKFSAKSKTKCSHHWQNVRGMIFDNVGNSSVTDTGISLYEHYSPA